MVTVQSMQAFLIFVHLRSTEASFQSDAVVCSRINIVQQILRNKLDDGEGNEYGKKAMGLD